MKNSRAKTRSKSRHVTCYVLLVAVLCISSVDSLQSPIPHHMKENPSAPRISDYSNRVSTLGSSDVVRNPLAASTTTDSLNESEDNINDRSLLLNETPIVPTKINSFRYQLNRRIAADPNFVSKSFVEIALAAGTQLIAESGRRGASRMLPEIDFVLAGVLTAVAGKYYSMWRVAPTKDIDGYESRDDRTEILTSDKSKGEDSFWSRVPTNAFQSDCPRSLEGSHNSSLSLSLRAAAFLKPIPPLFRAGVLASALGYGFTSALIFARSWLVPSYVPETKMVSIPLACIYTGSFMAIVSNIRYQLLSGIVEPKLIDRYFGQFPPVHTALVFLVRLANGILGSMLAITGMKHFGLQRLK